MAAQKLFPTLIYSPSFHWQASLILGVPGVPGARAMPRAGRAWPSVLDHAKGIVEHRARVPVLQHNHAQLVSGFFLL